MFNFLRTTKLFSTVAVPFYKNSHCRSRGFQPLTSPPALVSMCFRTALLMWAWSGILLWFWLALTQWAVILSIFSGWPFVCLLWRTVCSRPFELGFCGGGCWAVVLLCVLDIGPISDMWFADIFSHSAGCLHPLGRVLWCAKVFNFDQVHLAISFSLLTVLLVSYLQRRQIRCREDFCFLLRVFIFIALMFIFLVHFELIFVYDLR